MKIVISEIINSRHAVLHSDGAMIYSIMINKLESDPTEKIIVSFEGLATCIPQFLNACIGKLYYSDELDQKILDERIEYEFDSIYKIKDKLKQVKENAIVQKGEKVKN